MDWVCAMFGRILEFYLEYTFLMQARKQHLTNKMKIIFKSGQINIIHLSDPFIQSNLGVSALLRGTYMAIEIRTHDIQATSMPGFLTTIYVHHISGLTIITVN